MAVVKAVEEHRTCDVNCRDCTKTGATPRLEFSIEFDACEACYDKMRDQLDERTTPRKPRTRKPETAEATP